jgi:hypothetical protein
MKAMIAYEINSFQKFLVVVEESGYMKKKIKRIRCAKYIPVVAVDAIGKFVSWRYFRILKDREPFSLLSTYIY